MSFLFCSCESLLSLPDISKWDTSNIINMSFLFCDCNSLVSIPDISKWKWENDKIFNICYMFANCNSLISLFISSTSEVFHFDISGKEVNNIQL